MTTSTVYYDPDDVEIAANPWPTYSRLREEAPAYWNESLRFWALSRHADVLAAFKDWQRFSSRFGVSIDAGTFHEHASATMSFLAMDPPRHDRLRALVSKGFTPRRVAEIEPRIRALAIEHLDAIAGADPTLLTTRLNRRGEREPNRSSPSATAP